jgi:hypothetical protein
MHVEFYPRTGYCIRQWAGGRVLFAGLTERRAVALLDAPREAAEAILATARRAVGKP